MNIINTLKERGFIENMTHEEEIYDYLSSGTKTCYIGFDPTASSFHIGNLIQIMALAHIQRHGHRPIALVGGGTGLVGDPSGKTEMRNMLTREKVNSNAEALKKQLSKFIDFKENKALLLNNADWLTKLKYIEFLRDIGSHFSVNRMIKAESYKARLQSDINLSFIEFNYMVLQAFDFMTLFNKYDCRLQMGGSDQWGNIVAGIELIRRVYQDKAFGITSPLITTSSGAKMGKTASGAVWLDPERTSPYDYYQYWINTDDKDVFRFTSLFTFLPMDQIRNIEKLEGADLNMAKAVLAFETTRIVHGYDQAVESHKAAEAVFGDRNVPESILPASKIPRKKDSADDSSVPSTNIRSKDIEKGIPAFKLFNISGLTKSGSEARRLIKQGGAYINGNRVENPEHIVENSQLNNGELLLRAGKKRYHKIKISNIP